MPLAHPRAQTRKAQRLPLRTMGRSGYLCLVKPSNSAKVTINKKLCHSVPEFSTSKRMVMAHRSSWASGPFPPTATSVRRVWRRPFWRPHHSSALRVASARVAPMNTLSMTIWPAELPLQIDHAPLGRGVALDVALCGRQRSVSGQLLNVAQAAARLDDLLGGSGDKCAAP